MSFRESRGKPVTRNRPNQNMTAVAPPPVLQCLHRSWTPVGKLRCNCANQPAVYSCAEPWVASGYCIPVLPDKPGDGPLVKPDGTHESPRDERMKNFVPWVLKNGEAPAEWQILSCSRCPKRVDPPPHVATLKKLGINGNYDPATGQCDVLHLVPPAEHWVQHAVDYVNASPQNLRSCWAANIRAELDELASSVKCRLVVSHTGERDATKVIESAARNPGITFWSVLHGSQNSMCANNRFAKYQADVLMATKTIPNLWYGTPEPTADFTKWGYDKYLHWPNPMPFESPAGPLQPHSLPVILVSSRDDVIKGNTAKILATGLIAKRTPIKVAVAIKGHVAPLQQVAIVAGVNLDVQPIRSQLGFRAYIRDNVSIVLTSSLTDADQYVGRDALSQARPVVGSQTIRYLPKEWQADPNDPEDIARIALMFLGDYGRYSCDALRIGAELRDQQQGEYCKALERILS